MPYAGCRTESRGGANDGRHRGGKDGVHRRLIIGIGIGLGLLAAANAPAEPGPAPVRVGLYQNPPKASWSAEGRPEGFFIDLIEAIAQAEHWRIEYVPGTWAEGLTRLENGEIDLMPDVAFSPEREARFAFHSEPVLSSWFQIHARRGSGIRSLVDLAGKRVAVLERSIQQSAFAAMAAGFELATTLRAFPDYVAAFAALDADEVDAVITSRFYDVSRHRGSAIEDTGILFHPTRLFFAAPKTGNPALLAAIDRQLVRMKQDRASTYYRAFQRWTADDVRPRLPAWLGAAGLAAAAVLLAFLLWNFGLKKQVRTHARELVRRNEAIAGLHDEKAKSDVRYRELFGHMASGVAVYEAVRNGEDFAFADINPAGLDIAKLKRDDVLGKPVTEVFPGIREMGLLEVLRRVWRTGMPAHVPATHYADARLSHWYENHVYKLPSGEVVAIYDDATRRMEAQAALQTSEERFRSLFEQAPLGYQSLDADGRFIEVNQAWADMLGYPVEDVVGKWFGDFLAPEFVDAFRERFPQFKAAGKIHSEFQLLHRDGSRRFIAFEGRIAHNPDGSFLKTHCILTDITDRKRAEEELAAHYALLRIAGRTAALGGWSADLAANRVIWSDEVAAIHDRPAGYSPPVEEGISYYAPEWRGRIAAVFKNCAERGIPYDEIMEIVTARGRRRWVRTIGEAIRDDNGAIVRVHGAFQDITDQKAAEDERDRLQAQLNQMQKIESVGRLAGGVAHDFNNMLGTILGHAEMALDGLPADAPLHGHLLEIQRAAERSAGLTRQLLAFARKQTVVPKVLDLNETVSSMLQMLRRLIGENVELVWRPGGDLGPVKIDPSQIDQILTNLCVNARDAIAGEGQITIATAAATLDAANALHPGQPPGDYVRLSVRDNGCGMDPETLGRLFEPFFTTKEVGQGTGLGLPTVYGIVKQNGGFIDVDSAPGRGSTFEIFLPRHGYASLPAPAAAPAPPAVGGRETILLVEDEPSILAIGREMLKNLGYQVLGAASPGEALRQAQTHAGKIQLLITDVVMPGMNGSDLAQQLAILHPGIRRLFMSGYTADIIAHHGILHDDVHFIQKPFTLKELAAKVREILNG